MSEDTQIQDNTGADTTSTENQPSELELLKERATQMGISFHPSIGVDKLRAKVDAAIKGVPDPTANEEPAQEEPAPAPVLTEYQKTQMQRMEALKLVRVVVSCMNPAKQAWEGEVFTVGNDAIGTVRKYVPFNVDNGYHVPHIIYEQLLERQCPILVPVTDPVTGFKTSRIKLVREFNVVVLPQLTESELAELARQQAVGGTIE